MKCSDVASKQQICAVLRQDHGAVVKLAVSCAYEHFGVTHDGRARLDPTRLHGWADTLVIAIRRHVCHDDAEPYRRLLDAMTALRRDGVEAEKILCSVAGSFVFIGIYCAARLRRTLTMDDCADAVEHIAAFAVQIVRDFVRRHGQDFKTH